MRIHEGHVVMKVLVCGSRSCSDYKLVRRWISRYPYGTEFIHGDAPRGADALAKRACREFGYSETAFPARWRQENGTYDRAAGFKRNLEMLDQEPDLVLAFWDGSSKGTLNTITEAKKRMIRTKVIPIEPPVEEPGNVLQLHLGEGLQD